MYAFSFLSLLACLLGREKAQANGKFLLGLCQIENIKHFPANSYIVFMLLTLWRMVALGMGSRCFVGIVKMHVKCK